VVERLWGDAPFAATAVAEDTLARIEELAPQTDAQRSLKARAIHVSTDLAQTRLALFVRASRSIPMLSASAALFLILEMGEPFAGLMQIPSAPLRNALAPL
jgi:hypothetical protein